MSKSPKNTGTARKGGGCLPRMVMRIRHWLGINAGKVVSWRRADGMVMIGFKCECGKTHGIHPAKSEHAQPWVNGFVECEDCEARWMAVRPFGTVILECPQCGNMTRARECA